jgi:flagellar motor protein MotB
MTGELARTRHLEEPEGEGYFASVSDLMVGILFVFLLMLTVFALNFQVSSDELEAAKREQARLEALARERAEAAERAQREAEALQALLERQRTALLRALDLLDREVESRRRAREALLTRLRDRLEERGVRVEVDARSGVLRLPERALRFATRSADLDEEARDAVRVVAEVMAEVLPCFAHRGRSRDCGPEDAPILEAVLVEGHTDRRPLTPGPDFRDNFQLSAGRALTVYRAMAGAQPGLLALRNLEDQPLLGVSGYGETRPLPNAQGDAERDYAANRRIDIRFILTARTAEEIERLREEIRAVLESGR